MKISFIVPVYNGERFLRACADSILGQSVQEIELIFVNDGSTDGSQRILAEYAQKDARVRVLEPSQKGGASGARNLGLKAAKGAYIWFFDCDDILLAGAAEAMLDRAEKTGADLVTAGFGYLYEKDGRTQAVKLPMEDCVLDGEAARSRAMHLTALGGCKLWRAEMLRAARLEYPPYRIAEDVGFYLCALACCQRIAVMDRPVYHYRIHANSSIQTLTRRAVDCIGVFDGVAAFYAAHGVSEAMKNELLFDRMFHYLLWMKRLPRIKTRTERQQVGDAFAASRRALDLSAVQQREDIMKLVQEFDRRVRWRAWYESDLYAGLYCLARRLKSKLK